MRIKKLKLFIYTQTFAGKVFRDSGVIHSPCMRIRVSKWEAEMVWNANARRFAESDGSRDVRCLNGFSSKWKQRDIREEKGGHFGD